MQNNPEYGVIMLKPDAIKRRVEGAVLSCINAAGWESIGPRFDISSLPIQDLRSLYDPDTNSLWKNSPGEIAVIARFYKEGPLQLQIVRRTSPEAVSLEEARNKARNEIGILWGPLPGQKYNLCHAGPLGDVNAIRSLVVEDQRSTLYELLDSLIKE